MQDSVNAAKYPALHHYMSQLPNGLRSFPECKAHTELLIPIRKQYPELGFQRDLPVEIRHALTTPWKSHGWVPEVVAMAQVALLRDMFETTDEALLQGISKRMVATFNGPMRAGIRLISPKLLIMAANDRWKKMHHGTVLTAADGEANKHKLHLTYPPGLYSLLHLQGFAVSFETALRLTKVAWADVGVSETTAGACQFNLAWDFQAATQREAG